MGSSLLGGSRGKNSLDETHPINIGGNLYGVAACLAFLRMIFIFELHHRFGPILFCIKVGNYSCFSLFLGNSVNNFKNTRA